MLVKDLILDNDFTLISGESGLDREINGMYVCDLLSHAMAKAKEGNVFITVQNNVNSLAVASLLDLSCIIYPDNIQPDEASIERAKKEEIPIIKSSLNAVSIILKLHSNGII